MRYYKHPESGEVFAYETTEARAQWGAPELVDMTPEEIEAHLNPSAAPPAIPQQVTRAQGKVVLIQLGLWQPVLDYVAAITDPVQKAVAEVALHDTQFWQRNSPFLNTAAQALGITSEQMDQLFIQADQVVL